MSKIETTMQNFISQTYPQIASQWHPLLNGELTPDKIKAGSSKKVWWQCENGHAWQAIVYHRTKNHSNCPYCSGRYAIKGENDLQTLMPSIAKEWHRTKNKCLLPTDVKPGSNIRIWWNCQNGHEWQASVYDRTKKNGSGCPYCSGNLNIKGKTDLYTLFPEIAKEFDENKNRNISPFELFAKSGKKVWWKCDKGHSWQASVISRTKLKAGCPFCSGKQPIIGENDLASLRPDLASEWHSEKNKNFTPSDCTISSGRKVWWKCKEGHEWQAVVSTRTGKKRCGCPYCYGRYAIIGVNDLKTVKPELACEWHPSKNRLISPSQVLPNSNKKVWWQCSICGYEWRTLISARTLGGSGCPHCAGKAR